MLLSTLAERRRTTNMTDAAPDASADAPQTDKFAGIQKKPVSAHLKARLEGKKRFDSADYQMQNQLLSKKKEDSSKKGASALSNTNAPGKD